MSRNKIPDKEGKVGNEVVVVYPERIEGLWGSGKVGISRAQNSSNSSKYSVGRAFACPPEGGACLPDLSAEGRGRRWLKG